MLPTSILEDFWAVPLYLPYLQAPLAHESLEEVQELLGCRLPEALVQVLRRQNGGYVRSWPEPLDVLQGIGSQHPSFTSYPLARARWRPQGCDAMVSFSTNGHLHLCLDYRQGTKVAEPIVTLVDTEDESESTYAGSFEQFVLECPFPAKRALVFAWVGSREELSREILALTGIAFQDQGDDTGGISTFRARRSDVGWWWLTPNRVRRGFARPGERWHELLTTTLADEVLRHREHGAHDYFITTTGRRRIPSDWDHVAERLSHGSLRARDVVLRER